MKITQVIEVMAFNNAAGCVEYTILILIHLQTIFSYFSFPILFHNIIVAM